MLRCFCGSRGFKPAGSAAGFPAWLESRCPRISTHRFLDTAEGADIWRSTFTAFADRHHLSVLQKDYTDKVISEKEIADIYAFLLTIPAPPALNTIPMLNRWHLVSCETSSVVGWDPITSSRMYLSFLLDFFSSKQILFVLALEKPYL